MTSFNSLEEKQQTAAIAPEYKRLSDSIRQLLKNYFNQPIFYR